MQPTVEIATNEGEQFVFKRYTVAPLAETILKLLTEIVANGKSCTMPVLYFFLLIE